MQYDLLLEGKNALIVDCEGLLGQAIACVFTQHGAKVCLCHDETTAPKEKVDILVFIPQSPVAGQVDTSARAAFLATKTALSSMMQLSQGALVYVAPTLAISAMARAVGMDVCKYNIRSNCISYNFSPTKASIAHIPNPYDVANAALYFASEMGRLVTGETLYVDAGASSLQGGV